MKQSTIKNISWGILGGWVAFVYMIFVGVLYLITLIGAKRAFACFKFAYFILAPFGKDIYVGFKQSIFGNIFWAVTTGWEISLYCLLLSLIMHGTYFGSYLGKKWFHVSQLVIAPFSASFKPVTLFTSRDGISVYVKDDRYFKYP